MSEASNTPVTLPDDLRAAVHNSMMTGMPMLVSYQDAEGRGVTNFRGSTHVHDDGSLAIWVRSRQGGLQRAAAAGARLTLVYRNPFTSSFVNFQGVSQLVEDDRNDRIYEASPPPEKAADPQRNGIGVLVSLDRVAGVFMDRKIAIGA